MKFLFSFMWPSRYLDAFFVLLEHESQDTVPLPRVCKNFGSWTGGNTDVWFFKEQFQSITECFVSLIARDFLFLSFLSICISCIIQVITTQGKMLLSHDWVLKSFLTVSAFFCKRQKAITWTAAAVGISRVSLWQTRYWTESTKLDSSIL